MLQICIKSEMYLQFFLVPMEVPFVLSACPEIFKQISKVICTSKVFFCLICCPQWGPLCPVYLPLKFHADRRKIMFCLFFCVRNRYNRTFLKYWAYYNLPCALDPPCLAVLSLKSFNKKTIFVLFEPITKKFLVLLGY